MKFGRVFSTVACVTVTLAMTSFVGTAAAVTRPANDRIGGATVVSALPFSTTEDTTSATTDAKDAALNATCGAPVTNNSVWFTFTAGPSDTLLAVDTTGSDFSSGVMIAEGTPSSLTLDACGPVSSEIAPTSGTTYYILAFDDTGSGGTLQISIHGAGPVPPNDKFNQAQVISSLPYSQTVDTTGATTDAADTQANETCGAPSTGHSVWYKYKAGASDTDVAFGTVETNFSPAFLVATGTKGALTTLACGLGAVETPVTPGTTYYVMVFDAFGGPGGTLNFEAEAAPTFSATFQYKTHEAGGIAAIKGKYNCTNAGSGPFLDISGELVEIVGSSVVTGFFDSGFSTPTCDGVDHTWTASGTPDSGAFAPGQTAALTSSELCGDLLCVGNNQNVVLKFVTGAASAGGARVKSSSTRTTARAARYSYGLATHARNVTWGH